MGRKCTLAPSGMNIDFKVLLNSLARSFLKSHVHHKTCVCSLTFDSGLMAVIFAMTDEGVIPETFRPKLNVALFNKHPFRLEYVK